MLLFLKGKSVGTKPAGSWETHRGKQQTSKKKDNILRLIRSRRSLFRFWKH
ncbi:hypothetical protein Hanom_Chr09g00776471 [Helianthus anomalus]